MKILKKYYKEANYIHYSNCHEDFLLLKKYFKPEYKNVLSIASALDNSLSFLVYDNVTVNAFDFNITQVYLGKLKITGIKYLEYNEFLSLIGLKENSISSYNKIHDYLDNDVKKYFDDHLYLINIGLIHIGKYEQYYNLFRKKIFPLVTKEKNIIKFARANTLEEQIEIYNKYINTKRFKLMFKIFFSERVMKKKGRDERFFKYNEEKLSKRQKKRVDIGFNHVLNKTNPYFGYILENTFNALPFYIEEENFLKIKKNIDNIKLECKSFDDMLDKKYDFMNLSDIFEYMPNDVMNDYTNRINLSLENGGHVCFWNMMNKRELNMKSIDEASDFYNDRAFVYRSFHVYEK